MPDRLDQSAQNKRTDPVIQTDPITTGPIRYAEGQYTPDRWQPDEADNRTDPMSTGPIGLQ